MEMATKHRRRLGKGRRELAFSAGVLAVLWCTWGALLLFRACGVADGAEPKGASPPRSSAGRRFDAPVGVTWSNLPLRPALMRLAEANHVTIVLDRRVDPDQKVEFSAQGNSLGGTLSTLAARLKLGLSRVGDVAYLGPAAEAERLRTVMELRRDEFAALEGGGKKSAGRIGANWPAFSRPRELFVAAAQEAGLKVENPEAIEHDLWPEIALPPMLEVDRMSLIAVQFGLTFQFDLEGKGVRLVPWPETAAVSRFHKTANAAMSAARLQPLFPRSEITAESGRLSVVGPVEDQELVAEALAGGTTGGGSNPGGASRKTTAKEGRKVYRLQIAMPVGRLLRELGTRLDLTIRTDDAAIAAAGKSLETEVRVDVKDVSEDELLKATLEPAGLTYQRQGKVLLVQPQK